MNKNRDDLTTDEDEPRGADRRRHERRQHDEPVLLDTRAPRERRREGGGERDHRASEGDGEAPENDTDRGS